MLLLLIGPRQHCLAGGSAEACTGGRVKDGLPLAGAQEGVSTITARASALPTAPVFLSSTPAARVC